MIDYFALLDEPRRPWIEPELLKQKFLRLSSVKHPDRAHGLPANAQETAGSDFAAINSAYRCLREPKTRLQHLLELEQGTRPAELQHIPSEMMDLFFEVSAGCRAADDFLKEQTKVESPLLKLRLLEQGQETAERLGALQNGLQARMERLLEELRQIDVGWDDATARPMLVARLESIYRLLGFFSRWSENLRERIARLSFCA